MSFNFTPLTEEELNKRDDLLEEGIYDFEVVKTINEASKAGNPQAKIQLNVWDKHGVRKIVFDYLTFADNKFSMRKIRHFCDSVGIIEDYNKGILQESFEGLSGKLHVGIQEKMLKPNQEFIHGVLQDAYYPEKNVVIDYITMDNAQSKKDEKKQEDSFNDDLPF
jgi:hypothetical protein